MNHIYSPIFTIPNSYSFQLRVYGNGYDGDYVGNVSIFFVIQSGAYDDTLVWPFCGKYVISILKQHPNQSNTTSASIDSNVLKSLEINCQTNENAKAHFVKIGKPNANQTSGYGWREFISHNELQPHLHNNQMIVRCEIFEEV